MTIESPEPMVDRFGLTLMAEQNHSHFIGVFP